MSTVRSMPAPALLRSAAPRRSRALSRLLAAPFLAAPFLAAPFLAAPLLAAPLLVCALGAPTQAQPAAVEAEVDRAVAETLKAAQDARYSAAELTRLGQVIDFARRAHAGQVRDGGRAAVLHPLRVTRAILSSGGPVDRVAIEAAVLHDVIEDTRFGRAEIKAAFGERTAATVQWVSLEPVESYRGDKEARDKVYYERFTGASRSAHVVKYFDRLDNIRDMASWSLEGKLDYLQSTREKVIESLRERSPDLAAKLEAEVEKLTERYRSELAHKSGELERYRRADGTLRWTPLLRDRVLVEEGSGLAKFALALFLKELALVLQTGDRLRIEEFFDGLASTDFFVHYGLFVAGARGGEIAYARFLQAHVKPGFVGGLLKSNLALAAGLALPQLVSGEFSGQRFAISLASLGLASVAVQTQLHALRWVSARSTRLSRLGVVWRRAGKLGSFAYSVAETTVILIAADAIESALTAWKDAREAREALGQAGLALIAVSARQPSAAEFEAAAASYSEAWDDYRAWLLAPLGEQEQRLQARLGKVGEEAKRSQDERAALRARLDQAPALAASIRSRHGSVEAYLDARAREREAEISAKANEALAAYERGVAEAVGEIYAAERRAGALLSELEQGERAWLEAGLGAASDPYRGRTDRLAGWGRGRARARVASALGGASRNRPQTYEDQALVLELAARLAGQPAQPVLAQGLARLRTQASLDARLGSTDGLAGALRGAR